MKAPLLAAALLVTVPAFAQPAAPVLDRDATLLNVSAEAVVRRAPDLANFSAGVVTQAKTAGEALAASMPR